MQPVRLGNHELLLRLASGGAANVFLVRDLSAPKRDRLLALKILLPSLASNEDFLNMFFTEARIASRLRHENVVAITGFGQSEGIHCLAMEYVFGASLAQVLRASAKAKKPLTVGVLLRITAAVCDALHYAHELADENGEPMGLVHRDVTPQNILIGFNGVPKLTDFGIAKATGRGWETQAGIVKGKFSYMSPEQALGKRVDRRSDIFGAGIVLWEALTGRDLFRGSTPMEVLTSIREQKIEAPSTVVPGLTPIVDPIVMKALRRSPRQRYQTGAEMRDDILDLIRRAGVEIDSDTIAKEFYSIYGEEIGSRAVELRKAMAGKADIDALAKALGGHPLNQQQHLPIIPGGVNDPDPLGLFSEAPEEVEELDEGQRQQGRWEVDVPEGTEDELVAARADFDIIDEEEDHWAAADAMDPAAVTRWNEGQSGVVDGDDLLSMLSEEDATVGLLPKEFEERFGAEREGREAHPAFEDDEATVGVSNAQRLVDVEAVVRGENSEVWLMNEAEVAAAQGWAGPPTNPSSTSSERTVPRAPSLLLDEPSAQEGRPVPRAPSLLIEEAVDSPDVFDFEPPADFQEDADEGVMNFSDPDGLTSPQVPPPGVGFGGPRTFSGNEQGYQAAISEHGYHQASNHGYPPMSPEQGYGGEPPTFRAQAHGEPPMFRPQPQTFAQPKPGLYMPWPLAIAASLALFGGGVFLGYFLTVEGFISS